ncbi:site-specific integrase [Prevotella conceptionensis]|uniref:site-specific integrase n=1 Tax=Prevotella conceptionensis TaxID=340486 RepID=UPI0003122C62|nr:site-specific integrase [Prevotella conceptionensis]
MERENKTVDNMVKAYMRYLKLERNLSPNTIEAYRNDLRWLLAYVNFHELKVEEVKLEDLDNFSASLHDQRITPRSQARILSGVRSFFKFYFSMVLLMPTQRSCWYRHTCATPCPTC